MLMNSDDVGKSFEDKLSTIEESASLEGQVSLNRDFQHHNLFSSFNMS